MSALDQVYDNIITLGGGKYSFYKDQTDTVRIDRYREPWRHEVGDNALAALFDEALEQRKFIKAALAIHPNLEAEVKQYDETQGNF